MSRWPNGHKAVSRMREYWIWHLMRYRCESPKCRFYPRYGGRGIRVCERWKDFSNFVADMGPRPSPKYTLERIDNDGNYEPGNCKWATRREQSLNSTRVHRITFRGETHHIAEWARRIGMNPLSLASRLHKGWSVERALTEAVKRGSAAAGPRPSSQPSGQRGFW